MAVITRILAFAPLALLTLGGCSNERSKWVGTWTGMRQGLVTKAQENTPIGQSLMKIEIKIFDNGRYEMIEAGIPTKGEVKYGKDRAFLKVMSRFDKDLDIKHTDLILEMPSEGSVFYIDPDADFPQPAELTKSSTTATPEKT